MCLSHIHTHTHTHSLSLTLSPPLSLPPTGSSKPYRKKYSYIGTYNIRTLSSTMEQELKEMYSKSLWRTSQEVIYTNTHIHLYLLCMLLGNRLVLGCFVSKRFHKVWRFVYKIVSIHPCTHAVLYIAIQLLYIAMLQLLYYI